VDGIKLRVEGKTARRTRLEPRRYLQEQTVNANTEEKTCPATGTARSEILVEIAGGKDEEDDPSAAPKNGMSAAEQGK
jgi:hypothetical protein